MKKLLTVLILIVTPFTLPAQKKPLDHSVYESWPFITDQQVSNNGLFMIYTVTSEKAGSLLTIQATDTSWRQELPRVEHAVITADSRRVICYMKGDSICIITPGQARREFITHTSGFKTPKAGTGQWLAYQGADTISKTLVLRNLFTGKERQYPETVDYDFSDDGKVLVVQMGKKQDSTVNYTLLWEDLQTAKGNTIFSSADKATHFTFDASSTQLAFVVTDTAKINTLWYYQAGMRNAVKRVNAQTPGMQAGLMVGGECPGADVLLRFSRSGHKLIFQLQRIPVEPVVEKIDLTVSKVEVWNYQDLMLPTERQIREERNKRRCFTAIVNEGQDRVIRLDQETDAPQVRLAEEGDAEWALVKTVQYWSEEDIRPEGRPSIYLVSTKDGSRKLVKKQLYASGTDPLYAPDGKYLLWYDRDSMHYFTYNVSSGEIKNISKNIPVPIYDDEDDHPAKPFGFGAAGWLENDKAVLLYDRYDIWQADPDGVQAPLNVTQGYGRQHQTILRYIDLLQTGEGNAVLQPNDTLLLTAFNRVSKENGFFRQVLGEPAGPAPLTIGPYIYHLPQLAIRSFISYPFTPIKAKQANLYMVRRMSTEDYPNLYATKDFSNFVPLTDLHPQKAYNWITAELLHWKMLDGKEGQGILYKPENFDPKKKYPIIFYFYEKDADGLHRFITPEYSTGPLNISWYVSNGYLVCDPNIYYTIGEPGESAYNAIMSAANYLAQMPWVDTTHMGLQGHSFGGYQVNYLVTRTSRFAAAMAAASPTDLVSMYGTIMPAEGVSNRYLLENGQLRIGATLWEKPALYIKNSPVFYADRITTPLLMMHNEKDGAVPWLQGVELFTGMRRMRKPAWMLQYDDGEHEVGGKEAQDFTIRMAQFFDHYLKGKPSPVWLEEGIPAKLKGIDDGLRLLNEK